MRTAIAATGDTISGFRGGDKIDIGYMAFGANTTLVYTANNSNTGGTLTVDDGNGDITNIALIGQYTTASFALASDGHGGTMITDRAVVAQTDHAPSSVGNTHSYTANNSDTGDTLTAGHHNGEFANIALIGQYTAASFALAGGGHGGAVINDPAAGAQSHLASPHT